MVTKVQLEPPFKNSVLHEILSINDVDTIHINPDQNGFVPGGNIIFSNHTIRDILFYCNEENIPIIMLAFDYTKAFDSVSFEFIHKTFEIFNFGDGRHTVPEGSEKILVFPLGFLIKMGSIQLVGMGEG